MVISKADKANFEAEFNIEILLILVGLLPYLVVLKESFPELVLSSKKT